MARIKMEVFSFRKRGNGPGEHIQGSIRPSSTDRRREYEKAVKYTRHVQLQVASTCLYMPWCHHMQTSMIQYITRVINGFYYGVTCICQDNKSDEILIPICIFLDDLIYANLNGFVFKPAVAPILVYPEFCCRHCFSMRNLREIEPEFFVMPSLVRKIFVSFNWNQQTEKEVKCQSFIKYGN